MCAYLYVCTSVYACVIAYISFSPHNRLATDAGLLSSPSLWKRPDTISTGITKHKVHVYICSTERVLQYGYDEIAERRKRIK